MIYLIVFLVALYILTNKWKFWHWMATRSGSQLILLIVVITFAVFGVVKFAGF